MSNKFLFNPYNFDEDTPEKSFNRELAKQLSPPERGELGLRFVPMREMITYNLATTVNGAAKGIVEQLDPIEIVGVDGAQSGEEFGEKWEKMICQLVTNASNLFTFVNDDLVIEKNCYWMKIGKSYTWVADMPQCADIYIASARNEDEEHLLVDPDGNDISPEDQEALSFDDYTEYNRRWALQSVGVDKFQLRNLESIGSIYSDEDGELTCDWGEGTDMAMEYHAFIKRDGILTKHHKPGSIIVAKIIVPGHYTLAMIYTDEKRIEFFDSSGSFDSIGYRDGDENKPYSMTYEQRSKTRLSKESTCIFDGSPKEDIAVCCILKKLFPEFELVGLNTMNLQYDDRDAHCQTWVWLFVYMRHVYPNISTKKVLDFFHDKVANQAAYDLVDNWWKYLINFIPENHSEDILSSILETLIEHHDDPSNNELSLTGGRNTQIIYKSDNNRFYSWLKMFY